MSIKFKPTPKKDPRNLQGSPLYYATAVSSGKTGIDKLAGSVSASSTLSRADIHAAIVALVDEIQEELSSGRTVSIEGLGTFSISLRSNGMESPDKLTAHQIREAKINYRPAPRLRDMLKKLEFHKDKKK